MVKYCVWLVAVILGQVVLAQRLSAQTAAAMPSAPYEIVPSVPAAAVPTLQDSNSSLFRNLHAPALNEPRETMECQTSCAPSFSAYIDYLDWKARRTGLKYVNFVDTSPATGTFPVTGSDSLDLPRESGVRAGLGFGCGYGWELSAEYTNFFAASSAGFQPLAGSPVGLQPTQSVFSQTFAADRTVADTVAAASSLKLDIVDLQARWQSCLNTSVGFAAFGGVRIAQIGQQFTNTFSYVSGGTPVTDNIDLPLRTMAEGVRLGAQFSWSGPHGLRIFGCGAESVIVADFHARRSESDTLNGPLIDTTQDTTRVVPVVEATAGIGWSYGHWDFSGGYEFSGWFNMVDATQETGNLLIDGFYIRLGLCL